MLFLLSLLLTRWLFEATAWSAGASSKAAETASGAEAAAAAAAALVAATESLSPGKTLALV
jgi:hypothetical protein